MDRLAAKVGYKNKSSVAMAIHGDGMQMQVGTLVKFLDEMDCELIIMTDAGDEFSIDGMQDGIDYKRNKEKDWC